jgi:hypothetical protein
MPASSLIKFMNLQESNGQHLFWGRADVDGIPFRGEHATVMREDEYAIRAVRVRDFRNAFFDTAKPVENKLYCDIMDRCVNGWFQLIHIERFWRGTGTHYVEWTEFYMEDGTRTPYVTPGRMGGLPQ